jgi:hypothetical protein
MYYAYTRLAYVVCTAQRTRRCGPYSRVILAACHDTKNDAQEQERDAAHRL